MPGPQELVPGVVSAQLPPTGTPALQTHLIENSGLAIALKFSLTAAVAVASPTDSMVHAVALSKF